jgi:intein/homing endonuclease
MQPTIAFSFALNLPINIVQYIVQAKDKVSLASLNVWASVWASAMMKPPGIKGTGLQTNKIPRYVLMPSASSYLSKKREELGLYSEPGRSNKDGIYITERGNISYLPKQTEAVEENAKAYEKVLEDSLALSYEAGTPLITSQEGSAGSIFDLASPEYKSKIRMTKSQLHGFKGCMQTYNWDLNCIITTSVVSPDRFVSQKLVGCSIPDELNLANYMRTDFMKGMCNMFSDSTIKEGAKRIKPEPKHFADLPSAITDSSLFLNFSQAYNMLEKRKLVPGLKELIDRSMASLKLKSLRDEEVSMFEIDRFDSNKTIYGNFLKPDLGFSLVGDSDANNASLLLPNTGKTILHYLTVVANDARALGRSNLAAYCIKENVDPADTGRFFDSQTHAIHEFENLFKYVGGQIFLQAMKAIVAVSSKDLMTIGEETDPNDKNSFAGFSALQSEVVPFCLMFSKYVTDLKEAIFKKAEEIEDTNKHPKVSEEELNIAGSRAPTANRPGMQLFPHQAECLAILKNHPRFAVLDIAPGGGKCLVGDSLVPTSDGILSLKEVYARSDVSTNKRGFQEYITSVVSHENRVEKTDFAYSTVGITHKVKLSDGTVTQGLPEHKLWAVPLTSNAPEFIRLDNLRKGDWLPKALGTELYPKKTPILSFNGQKHTLTEELAEILGWLVAEGYVVKDRCHFEQHSPEMMARYINKAETLFGTGSVVIRKGTTTSAKFSEKAVFEFVRDLMTLGTSAFKEVPLCIRTAPKKYQQAFLRSLFEGDASIYHGSQGRNQSRIWKFEYCTISKTLVHHVKAMLDNMGILTSLKTGNAYKSNGHDHVKRVYRLFINWRALPKLAQEIGFLSTAKTSLLEEAVSHVEFVSTSAQQTTNTKVGSAENRIPGYELATFVNLRIREVLSTYTYEVPKTKNGAGGRTEPWSIMKVMRDAELGRKSLPASYGNDATNKYSVERLFRIIEGVPKEAKKELLSDYYVAQAIDSLKYFVANTWVQVKSSRKAKEEQVYDISVPGPHSYVVNGIYGHNTTLGIADISMTYADGLIKRPFIICPNGLVGNWAEDIHKHMEGRWNVIPVTTETYGAWGDERLTEMIKSAPTNTVVVVGNSFLGNRGKFQLILGNAVENVSDSLEFCKKFHPDYIFIDESHRMRNLGSGIHKIVKSMMQISSVKYGRIGTGTFIQNVLSDAVGQTALYNAQVFRTKEEFDASNKAMISSIGGEDVYDYTPDAPAKVKRRLSEFATIISYKRKEWAFMLPLPVETFISVSFDDAEDPEMGRAHRMFYDAVLKQTMEELKTDKVLQKLLKGSSEDDEDDDADDTPEGSTPDSKDGKDRTVTTAEGTKIDVTDGDDDSDNLDKLEAALNPYLQRLERILTDPLGDEDLAEVAKEFFGEATRDTFVTPKVSKVIERIKKNFESNEWRKGMDIKSSDIVDFNGKSYIFKSEEPMGKTKTKSLIAPDEDTENWKPQSKGKVLVFCRFTRSVDAIYRALPADLKKQAVVFHGEVEGNKWENLEAFKNDPKINILIANEMGISEGHNLQMASRFIRVESPWAPGELDQSSSRIFRPDVSGKYERQTIFLDWIICDGTLEVAKMGRLISKMLRKAQFDELDNPKYYKNLNPLNLPVIKMSLDNIKTLNKMADLCAIAGVGDTKEPNSSSYIGQYGYLVGEMAEEFREMKKTKRAYMIDVKPTPMPDDAKVIEFTPWVPNMKVPDRHDEGLLSLKGVLQEEDHPLTIAFKKDKRALNGQFVRCEFGLGTIIGVSTSKNSSSDEDEDPGVSVSKVKIELSQGGKVESLSASKVYLATKITEKTKSSMNKKAPKITKEDKERTSGNAKKAEVALTRAAKREKDFVKKVADVKRKPKAVEEPEDASEETMDISLYPVIYNEFLALEAVPEDATVSLKQYGFTKFGNYAWLPVKTYANFTKVLEYIESKYTLAPKTIKLLDSLHDSFNSGRGRKFAVELAPTSMLPQFYRLRHTMTVIKDKRKPDLKLYPVILNGSLLLVVDIATNPVIRKILNKTIVGTSPAVKFQEADGLEIEFFDRKSSLVNKVKELRQAGFNVINIEELKEEVGSLNLKQVSTK